jgi:hypothetical protein
LAKANETAPGVVVVLRFQPQNTFWNSWATPMATTPGSVAASR